MIGVTNNSVQQINAALIALKGEVKNEVKNEIINNIDNSVIGETYTAGDGIDITNDVISQTTDQLTFTGTQAQWEALTSAEKAKYGLVNRTDNNKGVYKNNNGTLELIADEAYKFFVDGSIYNVVGDKQVTTTTTAAVNITTTVTIPASGLYLLHAEVANISAGVQSNNVTIRVKRPNSLTYDILRVSQTSSAGWTGNTDTIVVPFKAGTQLEVVEYFSGAGFRYAWYVIQIG